MRGLAYILVLLALLAGRPAQATWHEASSENFVIYADDREEDVRRFAEMLERYHAAMGIITGRQITVPSPSNRVVIFAVGGERDMRRLSGSGSVAGFYVARAGRSRAFVQDIRLSTRETDFTMVVLLHEYAHQFLISSSRLAMPHWLSEGAAEFFAAARFPEDGGIEVGRPATHRGVELMLGGNIPVAKLISQAPDADEPLAFYGRSWLLYHFLTFDEARKGQLAYYWQQVAAGVPSLEAGRDAFGDLDQLDRELGRYMKQRRFSMWSVKPTVLPIGPIAVRPLAPGHAAMIDVIIRSQRGVDAEEAAELLPDARRIAARHPGDPHVLAALAEAEYDAGNTAEAIAAADRALALDAANENALVHKGYALFALAETADDRDTTYEAAMAPFARLNAIENDHPLPLINYYRTYAARGREPSETARHALERAAQLAPFDQTLWMEVALMQAEEGQIGLARASLDPLVKDPHRSGLGDAAAVLLAALERAPQNEPFDAAALLATHSRESEDRGLDGKGAAAGNE